MQVNLIAAVANGAIIGNKGKLPWHIPEDLKRFRELTMGKPVIMGWNTYKSIGKPLKGRLNILIKRNEVSYPDRINNDLVWTATSLDIGISSLKHYNYEEAWIIGGAKVYEEALEKGLVDKVYITYVLEDYEGDAFFPSHLIPDKFKTTKTSYPMRSKNGDAFCFEEYERIR